VKLNKDKKCHISSVCFHTERTFEEIIELLLYLPAWFRPLSKEKQRNGMLFFSPSYLVNDMT